MTEQDARARADLGELIAALSGFMRSTVPNKVGETTLHLISDRPCWDRLLNAAAKVAER